MLSLDSFEDLRPISVYPRGFIVVSTQVPFLKRHLTSGELSYLMTNSSISMML